MGSAALLDPKPIVASDGADSCNASEEMRRKTRSGSRKSTSSDFEKIVGDEVVAAEVPKVKKRNASKKVEDPLPTQKRPKRAAAPSNFQEKSFRLSDKSSVVEAKEEHIVNDEISAIRLTSGPDNPRPNRRLTDFTLHKGDGKPQHLEMSEVDDLFISGLILTLDDNPENDKEKVKGVRCEDFGRIESWAISGYEDGSPVVWVSTELTDYVCVKPASNYKNSYDLFFCKAQACIEVYKKLTKSYGGNRDLSLDELLAGVTRSMSGIKGFPGGVSVKEFVISQGDFIYKQLIGLDETSTKNDQIFNELPVLVALRDESKMGNVRVPAKLLSGGSLKIGDVGEKLDSMSMEVDDDKYARLLQEEEDWKTMKNSRKNQRAASANDYIKISEDEIANDYPLPAYYKPSPDEIDEYLVHDMDDNVELPTNMLHYWSLYNVDLRLISLELLPMKFTEADVTMFGSGAMTADNGGGFFSDDTGVSGAQAGDGVPIYLSAVKEWCIEFGCGLMSIMIRTDLSWYRLGKPSKQYTPWYETVTKVARLAISIINLLLEQSRVARLSFADVIKRVSDFGKDNPSYVSSNLAVVERFVVVHGQIILQLFAIYPHTSINKCAFVTSLSVKMVQRCHTKLKIKGRHKKDERLLNPRATMAPIISKKQAMQATATRLISKIWGEYYLNYSPEVPVEGDMCEVKEDAEVEEEAEEDIEEEDAEEKVVLLDEKVPKSHSPKPVKAKSSSKEIRWDGDSIGKTCSGESLYKQAIVRGDVVVVGGTVGLELDDSDEMLVICFVEYMYERSNGRKMVHGRVMKRGSETVLGNTANEREVFMTNNCHEFELGDIKQMFVVEIRKISWGHQYRKDNASADKSDTARAEEMKKKGLPMEYYCKSLYWPEKGAFVSLPLKSLGLGNGVCNSCKLMETQKEKDILKAASSNTGFIYKGVEYMVNDFVYVSPEHFTADEEELGTFKSGRNVGLKAFVVCQLVDVDFPKNSKKITPQSFEVEVRRFFRPEDASFEKAYASDVREVYYSEETLHVPVSTLEGKCEIRKKCDLPSFGGPGMFEHVFFCEHQYDPTKRTIKQLTPNIKIRFSPGKVVNDAAVRKKKGKAKAIEDELDVTDKQDMSQENRLATLDIFAGCGGLSEGLQQAGVACTKWAIEYEQPAGEAFIVNHPDALMFVDNCNVILRAIMEKCGDLDDCISTPEAAELAAKLTEEKINNLPLPGQVDFINGGPPCQGFSGMNRFNQSTWSKVQCEMILAFLSFADYFRPKFFLLENVRTFVSFNKGQTFRLTLASLLEMGYQVRFGVLEAGAFGISQSRKRAFIWAASPEENLPEWPEPMHVFNSPALKIALPGGVQYAAARSTSTGAPFRAITVRDTIGDLPPVSNGASKIEMEYENEPVSWFQKQIRADMVLLSDHISKEMNELNLIRCQRIPKRPGADWLCLPNEKVKLSSGELVDLIPWCLPNTAKRHNQWKGLFGRLDWRGNFPTSVTDPQPMGKVGMCFHPDQDRIVTVRECARSQGFRDSFKFAGNTINKHRQIGNAVPPPLAFALGRKLKEAVDGKGLFKGAEC